MMDKDLIGKVRTTATISDLPEELLTQVLVRLPLKDIWACVRVQKSWHSLINMFITLHSNHHHKITNPPDKKYLLFWNYRTNAYMIRVDDIQCEKYLTLKYPPGLPNHFLQFSLVSNGLICIVEVSRFENLYLWNPVIQKYKTLPNSPHVTFHSVSWKAVAFGFVPQINDYLVVYTVRYRITYKPRTHSIITCVYSLSTDSWRKITHHDHDSISIFYICQHNSYFVNGVAIWAGLNAQRDKVLVCFDTKTEMLRQIFLPQWLQRHRVSLICAFDQSIVYFVEDDIGSQLGMWVLKGDPMNELLWEKKVMVKIREDPQVSIAGVRNNGEPILRNGYDLISYNLDSHKSYDFARVDDFRPPFIIKPFAESLGLLDIDCP